jgi:hypothetical protein
MSGTPCSSNHWLFMACCTMRLELIRPSRSEAETGGLTFSSISCHNPLRLREASLTPSGFVPNWIRFRLRVRGWLPSLCSALRAACGRLSPLRSGSYPRSVTLSELASTGHLFFWVLSQGTFTPFRTRPCWAHLRRWTQRLPASRLLLVPRFARGRSRSPGSPESP